MRGREVGFSTVTQGLASPDSRVLVGEGSDTTGVTPPRLTQDLHDSLADYVDGLDRELSDFAKALCTHPELDDLLRRAGQVRAAGETLQLRVREAVQAERVGGAR